MEKNCKFMLRFENVKSIPFEKYDKNFTFIVNGKRYDTSRVKADLLSPIVSRYHDTDESSQEITLDTIDDDYFSDFLELTDFEEKDIDEKHKKRYIEYFYLLGNTNEYLRLQTEYFENLSIESIVDRLKFFHKIQSMNQENEIRNKVINFASEHFDEINKIELKTLELDLLEDIISNPLLKLDEEDTLIEFILDLCKFDDKYAILFEYVEFKNVKVECLKKFFNEFDIEFLNSTIWSKIGQRLISTEQEETERYKNCAKCITKEHKEGEEFNGILRYLSKQTGGNIHDNGTIEVTSKSIFWNNNNFHPKNLLEYQNTESNYYYSKNSSDEYICFDFKNRRIQLTSYTIKSSSSGQNNSHLKNWNVEVSNDNENWTIIDEHKNDSTLNGPKIVATFNIKQKTDFYRYVRLHQTGTNWDDSYYILFYSLEMYGKLEDSKSE